MPSGAPPPMQFANLQYAQPQSSNIGKQMQDLGKNLKSSGIGNLFQQNPLAAGAAIPGAVGPTSAGGPQGPMPLVQPPGQPAAQPPAMPPAGQPAGGTPPIVLPQIVQPQPQAQPQQGVNPTQNMTPMQTLDWLRRMTGAGQSVVPPGMPGSAALNSAGLGMLPSNQPQVPVSY